MTFLWNAMVLNIFRPTGFFAVTHSAADGVHQRAKGSNQRKTNIKTCNLRACNFKLKKMEMSEAVKYFRVNSAFPALHRDKTFPLQKPGFKSKRHTIW